MLWFDSPEFDKATAEDLLKAFSVAESDMVYDRTDMRDAVSGLVRNWEGVWMNPETEARALTAADIEEMFREFAELCR